MKSKFEIRLAQYERFLSALHRYHRATSVFPRDPAEKKSAHQELLKQILEPVGK